MALDSRPVVGKGSHSLRRDCSANHLFAHVNCNYLDDDNNGSLVGDRTYSDNLLPNLADAAAGDDDDVYDWVMNLNDDRDDDSSQLNSKTLA